RWPERIGLADKAREHPDRLSGGQQQRAAIARAIMTDPEVLLLDANNSALDPELIGEVLELVRELASDGATILMATHEMAFARDVAHRVLFLDGGVVVEEGPARELFAAPREPRTREFLARLSACVPPRARPDRSGSNSRPPSRSPAHNPSPVARPPPPP